MQRDYPDRPIVGVGVVVLRGQEVLLIQRAKPPKPSEWSLPGGAQDVGETLRDAAAREVLEETGLSIDVCGLVDVIDFIEPDENGRPRFHYSLIDFWAETGDSVIKAGDDASAAEWVPLDQIDGMPLWTETKRVIQLAAQMRDNNDNER